MSSGPEYQLHRHAGNGAAAPGHGAEPADDEISLQEIAGVLREGKWIILGCFLGVLALTAVYTFVQDPMYQATNLLYVNKQQSAPQLGALMGLEGGRNDVANEVEILKSRTIALGVADALLHERAVPGTQERLSVLKPPEDGSSLTRLDVMNRLRKGYVAIEPVGREVDLINVVTTSPQPQEATLISNLYAREYVEYNRASSRRRMAASREFLNDIAGRYRQELALAEDTLTTFLSEERVVAPAEEVKQLLAQIKDLRQRKYEAQLERTAARTKLRNLRQEMERIQPGLAEQLASGEDIALERLKREISEKVTQVENKYARTPSLRQTPSQDPELERLQQEIASLQEQVNERARKLVQEAVQTGGLGADVAGTEIVAGSPGDATSRTLPSGTQNTLGRLKTLQQQQLSLEIEARAQEARLEIIDENLARYTGELSNIPNKEVVLGRLERSMQTKEQVYLTLVEKLQEARVAEQSELGYVEVVDEALVPEKPVTPRVPLNLALGGLLGLLLGIGGAFARSTFDDKVRTPEDLKKRGYSLVGAVPDMSRMIADDFDGRERVTADGETYSTSLIALLNPLSPIAEHYRRLRTNLRFSRPDGALRTVMVTSSEPGEGKSVTSMNLAITMAQTGRRTAYVDADLRRSTGHTLIGAPREPGLMDLLFESYPASLERFATGVDDLYVIPAGSAPPNPSELLGSEKMQQLIERLKKEFDMVVIDTPPVLAVTDALLVAPQCDVTVLVCSAGGTTWPALGRSREALGEVGAKTAGVLLNRFDAQAARGGYGYGYGSDEYYGEKPARVS